MRFHVGMELHQLRYLVLLSEELSFTRAAARASVAQPALSKQIRKLEDELRVPLVDRTSRQVRMTDRGVEVAALAREAIATVEEIRARADLATLLLDGRVLIGVTPTPGPLDVARLLGSFHAKHGGVELALREGLSAGLADMLRRDELELAFVSGIDRTTRRGLILEPLASEPLVVIVPPAHSLAATSRVGIRDLRRERMIAFPLGATIRQTVFSAAAAAGVEPRIAFETQDAHRARALVAAGLGVAVVPRSDALRAGPAVNAVPLTGRRMVHELFLAWRAGRRLSPAGAALRELVRTDVVPAATWKDHDDQAVPAA